MSFDYLNITATNNTEQEFQISRHLVSLIWRHYFDDDIVTRPWSAQPKTRLVGNCGAKYTSAPFLYKTNNLINIRLITVYQKKWRSSTSILLCVRPSLLGKYPEQTLIPLIISEILTNLMKKCCFCYDKLPVCAKKSNGSPKHADALRKTLSGILFCYYI